MILLVLAASVLPIIAGAGLVIVITVAAVVAHHLLGI